MVSCVGAFPPSPSGSLNVTTNVVSFPITPLPENFNSKVVINSFSLGGVGSAGLTSSFLQLTTTKLKAPNANINGLNILLFIAILFY